MRTSAHDIRRPGGLGGPREGLLILMAIWTTVHVSTAHADSQMWVSHAGISNEVITSYRVASLEFKYLDPYMWVPGHNTLEEAYAVMQQYLIAGDGRTTGDGVRFTLYGNVTCTYKYISSSGPSYVYSGYLYFPDSKGVWAWPASPGTSPDFSSPYYFPLYSEYSGTADFEVICSDGYRYIATQAGTITAQHKAVQTQQKYVIKLSNEDQTNSDLLADVEPGKPANTLVAHVYDQNGRLVPNVPVKIESTVIAYSGGHSHDDAARHSSHMGKLAAVSPSTGTVNQNGKVLTGNTSQSGLRFSFTAPAIAGDHDLLASCTDGKKCEQKGPKRLWVGVKGLSPVPSFGPYTLTGSNGQPVGWTPTHHDNHYLTSAANDKLMDLGYWYSAVAYPFSARLQINDASLERGGIFDIRNDWKRPHAEHCRGTVVDIRANGGDGALSITSDSDPMIESIKSLGDNAGGIDVLWEVPKDENGEDLWRLRHFHVRLLGQEGLKCPQ